MLVFKGIQDSNLDKRLYKLSEVVNNKIYIVCQNNAWVNRLTFIKWLNCIWFKIYSFKPIEGSIVYFDRVTFHLTEDFIDLFNKNKCFYR